MVAVSGAALTPFNRRKDGSSFRDWSFDAFNAALELSDLELTDIDLLVVASESDFFTLQLNPASVLACDFGLTSVSTMRVEGGGASGQLAVHAGVQAIRAKQASHVAVVGVDPSASQLPAEQVKMLYSNSFDAWTDGMTGVSSTALYALSCQAFMARTSMTGHHLDAVTVANRNNAAVNPRAHLRLRHETADFEDSPFIASPYKRLHCSPLSDGAAAIVLSDDEVIPTSRKDAPRIAGTGAASDHMHLGARADPDRFSAKEKAMKQAVRQADIAPDAIGLAEIYDAYAGAQLQAVEALGLSDDPIRDLDAGAFSRCGRCPINLSGGMMGQGAPVGAIGVGQTATCALLLEGRIESEIQLSSPPKYALADTHGGVCTTAAVTILKQSEAA